MKIPILLSAFSCAISAVAHAQPTMPVTISVQSGTRQTFAGFGVSQGNWGREYAQLTRTERDRLMGQIFGELKLKSLRLWLNLNEYAPSRTERTTGDFVARYITSGLIADAKKYGVTDLLLAPDTAPRYLREKREGGGDDYAIPDEHIEEYARVIAEFIAQIRKETGVLINATGIQNEPNDLDRIAPDQFVAHIKFLRSELNKRGLQQVKIIAPESANVDGIYYDTMDKIKAHPLAWNMLDGVGFHSYNMAATERAAKYLEGTNKSFWMTEASANGPEVPGDALQAASLSTRFLADMNHRATHWIHFIGFEVPDPNDNATRIASYTTKPLQITTFQKFYYYRQLAKTFDVGAIFRKSVSSLDSEMVWTYGPKPRLTTAVAQNADGTWAIGITNFTDESFSETPDNSGYANGYKAQTFDVTIDVPELARVKTLTFKAVRNGKNQQDLTETNLTMRDGKLVVRNVSPLQQVTLRSTRAARAQP